VAQAGPIRLPGRPPGPDRRGQGRGQEAGRPRGLQARRHAGVHRQSPVPRLLPGLRVSAHGVLTMRNPWLCIIIVAFLGLGSLSGSVGMVLLSVYDKKAPEALVAMTSLCWGSLASFLVQPPRGSVGVNTSPTKESTSGS